MQLKWEHVLAQDTNSIDEHFSSANADQKYDEIYGCNTHVQCDQFECVKLSELAQAKRQHQHYTFVKLCYVPIVIIGALKFFTDADSSTKSCWVT